MLIGFWATGQISEYYVTPDGHNWASIWILPTVFSAVVFVIFAITFKQNRRILKTNEHRIRLGMIGGGLSRSFIGVATSLYLLVEDLN